MMDDHGMSDGDDDDGMAYSHESSWMVILADDTLILLIYLSI